MGPIGCAQGGEHGAEDDLQEQAGVDEGGAGVVLETGVLLGGDDAGVEADVLSCPAPLGGFVVGARGGDVGDADF